MRFVRKCLPLRAKWIFLALALALGGGRVQGHELNTSYTSVLARSDTLRVQFAIDAADIARGFAGPEGGEEVVGEEELKARAPQVAEYLKGRVRLMGDGENLAWGEVRSRTGLDEEGNLFIHQLFAIPLEEEVAELEMAIDFSDKFAPGHKNLAKVLVPGKPVKQAVFSRENPSRLFVLSKRTSVWEYVVEFTILGVEHIFIGYDHIMFLLALIAVGGRLLNLIKIVSSFTVAHSITLVLAALEIVSLPGKWVEAGIALSIAYVALENFWLKRVELRWIITFFFGLVHGFGFANVLRELGLPTKGLVASLLAFNIGVELGQICIVAVVFPLILWLSRQSFQRRAVRAVSALILLFGLGWFVERVFDFSYMPF